MTSAGPRLRVRLFLMVVLLAAPAFVLLGLELYTGEPDPDRHLTMAAAVGMAAAILLALSVLWNRLVARPLQSLEAGAAALGQGRMTYRVGHSPLPRELQRVADAFDHMADEVQRTRLHLERKVLERTVELRERNAQLQEATRYKSEFLANMSHEIRTPLNAVIGMANVLADMELGQQQRQAVETIRVSAHHLLAIISDILDISRIEAGHLDLEEVPMNLRDMVEESVALVAPAARRKGLDILVSIEEGVPDGIRADAGRLRQILVNLAGNAVKFTDTGHVLVQVARRGEQLEFMVDDTGPGVPPHLVPELFTAFHQLDSTSHRRHGGTGLGLAISQRLAHLMGGELEYRPAPTAGSRFVLQVPCEAAEPPVQGPWLEDRSLQGKRILLIDDHEQSRGIRARQLRDWGMDVKTDPATPPKDVDAIVLDVRQGPPPTLAEGDPPAVYLANDTPKRRTQDIVLPKPPRAIDLYGALSSRLGGSARAAAPRHFDATLGKRQPLRILVVEDSPVNQRVALAMLERFGYKADVAGGGAEAVAMAQSHDYDLILMDVEMPDMDGRSAARAITGQMKAYVVALTAHVSPRDRRLCEEAGMEGYLPKPVSVPALMGVLEEAWRRGHPEAEAVVKDAA